MQTPKTFKTRTRVRYAETDASGIVYYNNYFVYFEVGRVELFRQLGLPYDHRLPIVETHCRYHASARFDDELEIHTFLQEVRSKGFRLGCEVYRGEELLVEGYTAMVTTDENGQPVELPEAFRAAFEAMG
jgi:acyl-CoA thioester hydrolase